MATTPVNGLDDNATLIVDRMDFYTAPEGTAVPTKAEIAKMPGVAPTGWTNIGHTDMDNPLKITPDGGEVTAKGTLQKHIHRTSISDRKLTIELNLMQFDKATIKRFLGANTVEKNGLLYAKSKPQSERVALLGFAKDGEGAWMLHAASVDVSGNGDLDISSIEDLASIPLKFTCLEDADGNTLGISPKAPVAELGRTS